MAGIVGTTREVMSRSVVCTLPVLDGTITVVTRSMVIPVVTRSMVIPVVTRSMIVD